MSDDKVGKTLLKALESMQAHGREREDKRQKEVWKNIEAPCTLTDTLVNLKKHELDQVRKNLDLKNLSTLKKGELARELVQLIPSQFEHVLYILDKERYDIIKEARNNSGATIVDNTFPFRKVESLRDYGILFPGVHKNQYVLSMPSELITVFDQLDGNEIQNIVERNTEWIRLTQGLLYYYGVMDLYAVIDKVAELTGQKVAVSEFINVISHSKNYYRQLSFSSFGLKHQKVLNAEEIITEQEKRQDMNYYPFTKKQLMAAGEMGYVDRSQAMNNFTQFLTDYYDLPNDELNEIAIQIMYMIKKDNKLEMLIQFLESKLEMPSAAFVNQLMRKLMELHNNTPMWVLKGNAPRDLSPIEHEHLHPEPSGSDKESNVIPIRKNTKVGRNEPCICGSGKKYKKCCGK
ncbi:SEC-C metal-binding domain-containing protein [Virgibacillus litoralis]|uniref:Zinc chelation protein SecC n=1 Tax=Virgibacillus litoralis TaxID=578221 RepID=A0ABS4HBE3_9BACI|nr:SEC-C metal-binding domain-containing protein [Virgibacillus litoralis]MBP1948203.1 hypothetical protein [Virgibacillus litoralis]